MRIEVHGEDTISTQARTYGEYRLFATLAQILDTNRVTHARLALQRSKAGRDCDGVSCTVTVAIEGTRPLRIQASADHPYAAINRAVKKLSDRCCPSDSADLPMSSSTS